MLARLARFAALGAVAGAAGTLAMDLVWYRRAQKSDRDPGPFPAWETAKGLESWEDAPAPAQVGQKVAKTVLRHPLDARYARPTTNVVHWSTGVGWAAAGGAAAGVAGVSSPLLGLPFGAAVWSTSYLTLVPLGIYKWPWKYSGKTVWEDLSAHLVYGSTTGLTYWALRKVTATASR